MDDRESEVMHAALDGLDTGGVGRLACCCPHCEDVHHGNKSDTFSEKMVGGAWTLKMV